MNSTVTEPATTFEVYFRTGRRKPWKVVVTVATEDEAYRVMRISKQSGDWHFVKVEQPSPAVKTARKGGSDISTALPPRLVIEIDVPVRAISEANASGSLGAKIGRKKAVKFACGNAGGQFSTECVLMAQSIFDHQRGGTSTSETQTGRLTGRRVLWT